MLHLLLKRGRQEQPLWPSEEVRKVLDRVRFGGSVDDGVHFGSVAAQEGVEEDPVLG